MLQARPEDRRGFIEEAAGVLKHRKRKEKALRKLDAMQANLTRLNDLTAELRRQLKPLGRQAEIARRAAGVQAELRDSRLRLLADDLASAQAELTREVADEQAVRARRAEVEAALAAVRVDEADAEAALAAATPAFSSAQDTWYRLSGLHDRLEGTATLAAERVRHLSAEPDDVRPGRDPDELDAEAAGARADEERLQGELARARSALQATVAERQRLEHELAAAERAVLAAAQAVADRREGLARLAGQVNAARARAAAGAEEIERLAGAAAGARARAASAAAELDALAGEVGVLDEGEVDLDARHEQAAAALADARERVRELAAAEREAERERSTWSARRDALALGLTRRDGAGALLAAGSRVPGVLGTVAALLSVEPGAEAALAAALGPAADAVAVDGPDAAVAALELLKSDDAGRAGLLVGDTALAAAEARAPLPRPALPPGAVWAADTVRAPAALAGTVAAVLDGVVLVPDLPAARAVVADLPGMRAVTRAGDLLGPGWAVGGSASAPSALEIQAAVDEAQHQADDAAVRHGALHAELAAARAEEAAREDGVTSTLEALNESDARLAAVTERLAELGQASRSAAGEADRLEAARAAAEDACRQDVDRAAELEQRLRAAEAEIPADGAEAGAEDGSEDFSEGTDATPPAADDRDRLSAAVTAARQSELDARLAVRTGEERVRAVAGRADQLARAATAERAARERLAAARQRRTAGAAVAAAVREAAVLTLATLERSLARAGAARDAADAGRADADRRLQACRARARELDTELGRLTDAVHRDEVARAEQRMRIGALETRAVQEYGVELEALLAEYGPGQPCPPSALEVAEYEQARERGDTVVAPQPGPYDRATQEKRAARAERDLALLGKVNPLALEEFAALEERHQFLATQLEDLKNTRRDLLTVVKEVDDRILEVFASAFADVAREFETVFATLFPGGEGRLVLTDPDDLLLSGVEVEARPAGKKVKRLSLLSGGERSLTAVALLVAIFRARPSPFYVMDEVEAALDDVNLGRLLQLIGELRATSQLLVVTHQKRTMEIADALYGVTMRGDGITQVISQRLRDAVA